MMQNTYPMQTAGIFTILVTTGAKVDAAKCKQRIEACKQIDLSLKRVQHRTQNSDWPKLAVTRDWRQVATSEVGDALIDYARRERTTRQSS